MSVYVTFHSLLTLIPSVCRMMRWLCRGRFVPRCFSWRTHWLRSGRSTRCCASNLNRLSLPTSKRVTDRLCRTRCTNCTLHRLFSFFILLHSELFFLSGPINREMRHLISTLQTHNQQMKGEVVKYKIRLRETQSELNQVSQKGKRGNSPAKVKSYSLTYRFSKAEHNSTSN